MTYDHDKTDGSDAYAERDRVELEDDGADRLLEQLRAAGDRRDWDECDRLEAELDDLERKSKPAPAVQSMVRPGEFRVRGAAQPGASWPTTAEGFEAAREEQRAYDTQLRWQRSRKLALEALRVAEQGASMPWPRIEHLLSELVCELGCACCGKPFERSEVFTVEYVRARGVHANNCEGAL